MGHFYFDSSALIKRYVAEIGTNWVVGICTASVGHVLYTVRISGAEIAAALFRRVRMGSLTASDAQAVVTQFKADFRSRYQIVEATEQVIDSAMILAEKHGLRGYDSVHLAAALELQATRVSLSLSSITFVCADDKLNAAAVAEGLPVENPGNY